MRLYAAFLLCNKIQQESPGSISPEFLPPYLINSLAMFSIIRK